MVECVRVRQYVHAHERPTAPLTRASPAQAELLDSLQQQDQQRALHLQERELKLNPHIQGKGTLLNPKS